MKVILMGWGVILCGFPGAFFAQSSSLASIEDKELLEITMEDTLSELARNQASLAETKAVYQGLEGAIATEEEFHSKVEEYIRLYEAVIASQKQYLSQLRQRRQEIELQELEILRDLSNFGSPYQDRRRTDMLDSMLQPRSSAARFGISGETRLESLDQQLLETLGSLQERLDEETLNRQEARKVMVDRAGNVKMLIEMQKVSQTYYDERLQLYHSMNQTYQLARIFLPGFAQLFKPPLKPKPPDAYRNALDRMDTSK